MHTRWDLGLWRLQSWYKHDDFLAKTPLTLRNSPEFKIQDTQFLTEGLILLSTMPLPPPDRPNRPTGLGNIQAWLPYRKFYN